MKVVLELASEEVMYLITTLGLVKATGKREKVRQSLMKKVTEAASIGPHLAKVLAGS